MLPALRRPSLCSRFLTSSSGNYCISNLTNPGTFPFSAYAIVDPLPKVKLIPLVFGSVRWPLGFQGRRAMQPKPGLALLPEPIALGLDHEGVAVMQESIEDGGGDDVVAEDLTPLRHALIRRDQHRRFLVAMAHELRLRCGSRGDGEGSRGQRLERSSARRRVPARADGALPGTARGVSRRR